jgi:hypothetical protein
MKKFTILMLLCLGLSIGANAQDSSITTKVDTYAKELASVLQKGMDGTYSDEEFDQKCSEIGVSVGVYIIKLSPEERTTFVDKFYTQLVNYCEQYGMDSETSVILATAIRNELTLAAGGEVEQSNESVDEMAKRYASEMVKLCEASFLGADNDKEAERLGAQLGVELARLGSDNIKVFREVFYSELESQMAEVSGLDAATRSLLLKFIKLQYDSIFQEFM